MFKSIASTLIFQTDIQSIQQKLNLKIPVGIKYLSI